jgi:flavin reductase (DIM6/NTAB) family NADH-FMN oxidoreductase RutF
MFAANQNPHGISKDSVRNAEATKRFGWSLATYDLREAVNKSAQSVPYEVDEFEIAGLEKTYGKVYVDLPLVKESPVRFECEYFTTWKIPGNPPVGSVDIVVGRVVGIHVDDAALNEQGRVDVKRTKPIARLGYYEYAVIQDTFEMIIPGDDKMLLAGLEGSATKVQKTGPNGDEKVEVEDEQTA